MATNTFEMSTLCFLQYLSDAGTSPKWRYVPHDLANFLIATTRWISLALALKIHWYLSVSLSFLSARKSVGYAKAHCVSHRTGHPFKQVVGNKLGFNGQTLRLKDGLEGS